MNGSNLKLRVVAAAMLSPSLRHLQLASEDGAPLPPTGAGAHVLFALPGAGRTHRNAYSLVNAPGSRSRYDIIVRRVVASRGGSAAVHERLQVHDTLEAQWPANLFPPVRGARRHLMIAGGIGITPFMSQIAQLARMGGRFELHYAARSAALGTYMDRLTAAHPDRVHCYFDDRGERIDLARLLAMQPIGTHLYVCGPKPMIGWVLETAEAMGWPRLALHSEEFLAPGTGLPFEVELAASGRRIKVGATQSLLEAIEAAGVDAPYLCRGGACGQCETAVLRCDGKIVHRDHWLSPADQAAGTKIMPCVSRFEGRTLVIDR